AHGLDPVRLGDEPDTGGRHVEEAPRLCPRSGRLLDVPAQRRLVGRVVSPPPDARGPPPLGPRASPLDRAADAYERGRSGVRLDADLPAASPRSGDTSAAPGLAGRVQHAAPGTWGPC